MLLEIDSYYLDKNKMFFLSGVMGGLFLLNWDNDSIIRILPAEIIFLKNEFHYSCIRMWRNNLIIIPYDGMMNWVVVRPDGKVEYWDYYQFNGSCLGIEIIEDFAFVIPGDDSQNIKTLDLNKKKLIEYDCEKNIIKSIRYAWGYENTEKEIIVTYRGNNKYLSINKNNGEINYFQLDENLNYVTKQEDNLWFLPENKDYIIKKSLKDGIISRIDFVGHKSCEYIKIYSITKYIIFLPRKNNPITIYNTEEKSWMDFVWTDDEMEMDNQFWYIIYKDPVIYLPSYRSSTCIIDLFSMTLYKRPIFNNLNLFKKERLEYLQWKINKDCLCDENTGDLSVFLSLFS